MNKGGAPAGNQNAAGHGLYSTKQLTRRVTLPEQVQVSDLAEYSQTLGDAALAIAEGLHEKLADASAGHRDQALVGLYASVAEELFQVAAELEGVDGIKPSSLGKLSDAQFEMLMRKEGRALELVLSQCLTAWKRIQDKEEVTGAGLVDQPVLKYLAAHMRAAKRMMREMAGNMAWRERGMDKADDLGARLIMFIDKGREE